MRAHDVAATVGCVPVHIGETGGGVLHLSSKLISENLKNLEKQSRNLGYLQTPFWQGTATRAATTPNRGADFDRNALHQATRSGSEAAGSGIGIAEKFAEQTSAAGESERAAASNQPSAISSHRI